jgi:hypothetical protein
VEGHRPTQGSARSGRTQGRFGKTQG